LRYVIVREVDGDVMVALVVAPRTPRTKIEHVANALSRHPAIRSVVSIENDRRDGAIIPHSATAHVLFGKGALVEEIAGVKVEVGAGEFLQVNRAQAAAMYERVAELADARPNLRAIDLFAGVGGIGLHLARRGVRVLSVEVDREAVGQLRRAAERSNLPLTAHAGDAGMQRARDMLVALGGPPDVVVVNPPRKGLSEGARELLVVLVELAPRVIIYVSCGPEALGRDLAALTGYEPDVIEPFDLMPGTAQIETVVRLIASHSPAAG
jgi:23S rRNA (uracil1939-C5)-methyltransferase